MPQGILFPALNSEILVPYNRAMPNIYHTRQLNTDLFQNSIPRFQSYNNFWNNKCANYFLLKQFDDFCNFQFSVLPYTSLTFTWVKGDGTEIPVTAPIVVGIVTGNTYDADGSIPPVQLYTAQINQRMSDDLTDEGFYILQCVVMGTDMEEYVYISEPYWLKTSHPDTVLIQYSHSQNDYDIYFDYGPNFNLRIPAYLDYTSNTIERTTFRDQKANLRQLYGRDWRLFNLYVGQTMAPYGIPPYLCDKLAKIQKCDVVFLDGKRFIMEEGAEFEPTKYGEYYPLRTLNIQFAEYYSRDSDQYVTGDTLILFGSGDVVGYPYAITTLSLTKIFGPGASFLNLLTPYTNGIKLVFSTAEENQMIIDFTNYAQAAGLTGSFTKSSGNVEYVCGDSESYSSNVLRLYKTLQLNTIFASGIGVTLAITYQSNAFTKMVVAMRSGTTMVRNPIFYDNTTGTNANVLQSGSGTSGTVYIFHNDELNLLNINGNATSIVRGVSGVVPVKLTVFSLLNFIIPSFNPNFIVPSAQNLQSISFLFGQVTSFSGAAFAVVNPLDWSKVTLLALRFNSLSNAAQDTFYIDIFTTIFAAGYITKFTLDTRDQTPASAPTGASLSARNAMTASGNTILF